MIPVYAKNLVSQGVQGLFLNGSAGESVSLTCQERKRILEAWMQTEEVLTEKLKVIAHCGCNIYSETVELVQHAAEWGVKGVCIMNPTYFKPSTTDHLAQIVAEVANQVPDSPFYYYYIPYMSGVKVQKKPMSAFVSLSLSPISTTNK